MQLQIYFPCMSSWSVQGILSLDDSTQKENYQKVGFTIVCHTLVHTYVTVLFRYLQCYCRQPAVKVTKVSGPLRSSDTALGYSACFLKIGDSYDTRVSWAGILTMLILSIPPIHSTN
jgi:hypothetical protein